MIHMNINLVTKKRGAFRCQLSNMKKIKSKSVTCTLLSTVTWEYAQLVWYQLKKKGSVEELKGDGQVDMGVRGQVGNGQIDIELVCRQVEVGQADMG